MESYIGLWRGCHIAFCHMGGNPGEANRDDVLGALHDIYVSGQPPATGRECGIRHNGPGDAYAFIDNACHQTAGRGTRGAFDYAILGDHGLSCMGSSRFSSRIQSYSILFKNAVFPTAISPISIKLNVP